MARAPPARPGPRRAPLGATYPRAARRLRAPRRPPDLGVLERRRARAAACAAMQRAPQLVAPPRLRRHAGAAGGRAAARRAGRRGAGAPRAARATTAHRGPRHQRPGSRRRSSDWLGRLPIALHAEHGHWSRSAAVSRSSRELPAAGWRAKALEILADFAERTPGSLVEEKPTGLAWHYRAGRPRVRAAAGERAQGAPRVAPVQCSRSSSSRGTRWWSSVRTARARGSSPPRLRRRLPGALPGGVRRRPDRRGPLRRAASRPR